MKMMTDRMLREKFALWQDITFSEDQWEDMVSSFDKNFFVTPRNHEVKTETDEEYIYLIHKGILRVLYNNPQGKECNVMFLMKGDVIILNHDDPFLYKYGIKVKTIGKAEISRISKSEFVRICGGEDYYFKFYKFVMGITHSKAMQNYLGFLYKNNYERYETMMQLYGEETMKKITVKQIASFLGIFPESLARIRRKYKKENQ